MDTIEALTLSNTPDVFGLHPNAEIGYYTHSAKDMWNHLVELQPQTGGEAGGVSREEFIGKIVTDIQGKLPPLFDVDRVRKSISEITPTYVVLLQELDRFNVLIRKMSTSLINLQRVGYLTGLSARVTIFVLGRRFGFAEGWGKGIFAEEVGVGWKKCAMRKRGSSFCPTLLPVKDPITRCVIENLVY